MDWSQILIPALVAACVSIGFEFAARPGLEMRRERILRKARNRAESADVLHRVVGDIIELEQLSDLDTATSTHETRSLLLEERNRLVEQIEQQSVEIYRLSASFTSPSDRPIYEFLTSAAGALRGAALSGQARRVLDENETALLLTYCIQLLEHSRWSPTGYRARRDTQPWRRRMLRDG